MARCKVARVVPPLILATFALVFIGCGNSHLIEKEYYSGVDLSSSEKFESTASQAIFVNQLPAKKEQWAALETIHEDRSLSDHIQLFYSRRKTLKSNRASGKNSGNNDYWNREHVWPRSYGLKGLLLDKDLHNLVAVDRSINSSRGNKYFDNGGDWHAECGSCKADFDSWEPPGTIKGDIARISFYVNLMLRNYPEKVDMKLATDRPPSSYTHFGDLSTLLQWHCIDPVSDFERERNDIIYLYQKNRNPFVDHPEWVDIYFDSNC